MRFLILNADYSTFLRWLYAEHVGLERRMYEEQMQVREESLFGWGYFYSSNLRKLGHEAHNVYTTNEIMQRAWASEHGVAVEDWGQVTRPTVAALSRLELFGRKSLLQYLKPFVRPLVRPVVQKRQRWFYDILAAQIKDYKPDVLLNQAVDVVNCDFLRGVKPHMRLLMGQVSCPLPQGQDWGVYDVMVSSLPNFVDHFVRSGVPSELHRFAFEPGVLPRLENGDRRIPVSFVGSFAPFHQARVDLLEHLCSNVDIKVWGDRVESLPQDSPIRTRYMGSAWGLRMYQIMRGSKISVNHHGRVAGGEPYAANLRLFEATGVGALLITDWKDNLCDILEPGKEAVAFRTPAECAELVRYYLEHDEERESIARAGQRRTLREHTYSHRVRELVDIVRRYLPTAR